ncbi:MULTISPECIES: hypothetical protein [Micromonospora]|uniref:hypothetical protein n=1 Tax=Micromonospora TaxID=1873 RepID=UPI000B88473E|nr:hypothetical protein [Micromonospora yangpuensis]
MVASPVPGGSSVDADGEGGAGLVVGEVLGEAVPLGRGLLGRGLLGRGLGVAWEGLADGVGEVGVAEGLGARVGAGRSGGATAVGAREGVARSEDGSAAGTSGGGGCQGSAGSSTNGMMFSGLIGPPAKLTPTIAVYATPASPRA